MTSIIECAKLAEHAYEAGSQGQPDGWNRLHQSPGAVYRLEWGGNSQHRVRVDSGFFGAIYKHTSDKFVVAFRGTEPTDPGDIGADVSIGRSLIGELGEQRVIDIVLRRSIMGVYLQLLGTAEFAHRQVDDAKKLMKYAASHFDTSPKNCVVTGHSLGGALAKSVAAGDGYKVVAFNAPGVLDSSQHPKAAAQIVNVRASGDVVSMIGPKDGTRREEVVLPLKMTVVGKYGRQIEVAQGALAQHSMSNLRAEIVKNLDRFGPPLL